MGFFFIFRRPYVAEAASVMYLWGHCAHHHGYNAYKAVRAAVAERSALVVRWRPRCDTLSTPTSRRKGLADWRGGVDVVVQQHHRRRCRHHIVPHIRTASRAHAYCKNIYMYMRGGGGDVDDGTVARGGCGGEHTGGVRARRARVQPVTSADESL